MAESKNALRDPNPFGAALSSLFTPIEPPQDTLHFAALGRLITAHAAADAAVHMVARILSGLDDTRARIVFGGLRVPDLIERIHKLMEKSGALEATRKEAKSCLDQLQRISTERDKMAHRYVEFVEGLGFKVHNLLTAKSVRHAEEHFFDLDALEKMKDDLQAIFLRLLAINVPDDKLDYSPYLRKFLREPWRYKPRRPKKTPKPPRVAFRSREHPPRPSQESS